MQQRIYKTPVKRMDEVAREQETREHEETLSKARRASRKAFRATLLAQRLVNEINGVLA